MAHKFEINSINFASQGMQSPEGCMGTPSQTKGRIYVGNKSNIDMHNMQRTAQIACKEVL
jgi:hypothetical protein